MNAQNRRTTGKYRVAEDHFCQGVKKRHVSAIREGRKKERRKRRD